MQVEHTAPTFTGQTNGNGDVAPCSNVPIILEVASRILSGGEALGLYRERGASASDLAEDALHIARALISQYNLYHRKGR